MKVFSDEACNQINFKTRRTRNALAEGNQKYKFWTLINKTVPKVIQSHQKKRSDDLKNKIVRIITRHQLPQKRIPALTRCLFWGFNSRAIKKSSNTIEVLSMLTRCNAQSAALCISPFI